MWETIKERRSGEGEPESEMALGDFGGLSERGGRAGVKNILEDDEGVSERGGGMFKWEVETEGATSTKERCRNKLEAKRDQLSTTKVKAL